jgi:hypothetical protein
VPPRRRRWLARPGYLASAILGVVGIAVSAAGVALFPWPSQPPEAKNFTVNALGPFPIGGIDVDVVALEESRLTFVITVWSVPPSDAPTSGAVVDAYVVLPRDTKPVPGTDGVIEQEGGAAWIVFGDRLRMVQAGDAWKSSYTFTATAGPYGYASNGVDAVVALPRIDGSFEFETEKPYVTVTLPVAHAKSLRWDANPPTSTTADTASWEYRHATPEIDEATAIDTAQVGIEQFKAFSAGALVAIGTGAALMVVPEVIHERANRRDSTSRSRQRRRIQSWRAGAGIGSVARRARRRRPVG